MEIVSAQPRDAISIAKILYEVHELHHDRASDFFCLPVLCELETLIRKNFLKWTSTSLGQKKRSKKESFCFVATHKKEIVWFCCGYIEHTPKHPMRHPQDLAKIEYFWVSKEFQNTWIWSQILVFTEDFLQTKHITQIELQAWSFNENAIKFYKKHNFNKISVKLHKIIRKDDCINKT